MPDKVTLASELPAGEPVAVVAVPTRAVTRTTHGTARGGKKKSIKTPTSKPRAKSASKDTKRKKPSAARTPEPAATAGELAAARREAEGVAAACREAQSRLAALRADLDRSAADIRGAAGAAEAAARHSLAQADRLGEAVTRLGEELAEARGRLAAPGGSRTAAADEPPPLPEEERADLGELPEVAALPPDELADDIRDRVVRLLSDAWGVEKEQVDLLQTLADDCGDRDLRVLLEAHRADGQERQRAVAARLEAFRESPASGRGLLGQLVTRIWDAVQSPRDQADRALLAVLKALSTAEFQSGQYAALHATARFAGDADTAALAAAYFREERDRAGQLRAALVPTVGRACRR